jgi:outer membrane lipoprotein SlyB
MGYLIGAIVLGMLIWAGIEIVQTIRNWEPNPSATTQKVQAEMVKETSVGQFGGDAVEGVGYAILGDHHAVESATCEIAPNVIGHALEGLMHAVHH